MARAIRELGDLFIARARLGRQGARRGSPLEEITDGDTLNVELEGDLGVRLLGVDAAERSYRLPGGGFAKLDDERWEAFLANPFAPGLAPFVPALDERLTAALRARTGPGTAANQDRFARLAEDALERQVTADLRALGQDRETFSFFLAFAEEIVDGFGRLLAYVNREQPSATEPTRRPPSYNERLLAEAVVIPYFIWPNVNPFRREPNVVAAVPEPGALRDVAQREETLRRARAFVRGARERREGVFAASDPLRLLPFELRFLADRQPPMRWVADLSSDRRTLLPPQRYLEVEGVEDRLFVPPEYVPLWEWRGWRRA